jgi:uncharacterized membrane protein
LKSFRLDHFSHHRRFYLAILCGVAIWLLPYAPIGGPRINIAGAMFFATYLCSTALLAHRSTTADLRRKANLEDEGIVVIVVITLAVITLSIGSLLLLLLEKGNMGGWGLIPAILNVPLGWATLHTVMAFHYAHLFYSPSEKPAAKDERQTGGLAFPRSDEPGISDFLYFSFVVGMTAQTSDVDVTSSEVRKTTVLHGVVSFFYNTVILALAVSIIIRN